MACNTDPCTSDPCNEYDNCGCLYPSTFGCVTHGGTALPNLDIANGEDGDSILTKIDEAVGDIGKVLLDANDECPEYLSEKISAGLNIDISYSGTGCDRTMVISATEGGVPVDVNVKVSSDDTTSGYLYDKVATGSYLTKDVLNDGANEQLEIDVNIATLISGDVGNQLTTGTDGGLKTLYTAPDGSETKVIQGTGVTVTGTGTTVDPYIVSTNPSIQAARACFDAVWRNITLVATGNPNVTYVSGAPQYRYRFDGTVEFRGSISYTVDFGTYQTANRKFTVPMGNIPITCLTAGELIGTSDLKSINYIDIPQASADQIVQQYGYIIRKSAQNLILEFQSAFTNATSKSIVVNLEGAVIHPII